MELPSPPVGARRPALLSPLLPPMSLSGLVGVAFLGVTALLEGWSFSTAVSGVLCVTVLSSRSEKPV